MDTFTKVIKLLDNKTRFYSVVVLIATLIGSVMELIGVAIVLPIINMAMEDSEVTANIFARTISRLFNTNDKNEILILLIVATIVIYIIKAVYMVALSVLQYSFSMSIKRKLSVRIITSYLKKPYEFFLNTNSAELLRTVTTDTEQFYQVILNVLMITSNFITATAIGCYLIVTNLIMALSIICMLLVCVIVILFVINKRFRDLGKQNQYLSGVINKILLQVFNGAKEIKIMNIEEYFVKDYKKCFRNIEKTNTKYQIYNHIPKHLIETVCITSILVYMGLNIAFSNNYLSLISQLAVFCVGAYKMLPSISAIAAYMSTVMYYRASVDLIYDVITETEKNENNENDFNTNESIESNEIVKFNDNIRGKNLYFKYTNSEDYVLNNVNICIKKGQCVGFVGTSGGGKTTLVDVLLNLLEPTKGVVEIDGFNTRNNVRYIGQIVGYIPQVIYLIDDTIRRNVAFGVPEEEIDDEKVILSLKKAQIYEYTAQLPNGVNTIVGERGTRLSGGQRQRIGIARALYRDPEILVLDEATSALDNETEEEIMKSINLLKGEITIIMIAHRLSTIKNCDVVYEVSNGTVSERRIEDLC